MSEVNADGVLLNPHEAILQEVQALSNALMAEAPEGLEDDMEHEVYAANGAPAGRVGGAPHIPTATAAPVARTTRRPSVISVPWATMKKPSMGRMEMTRPG